MPRKTDADEIIESLEQYLEDIDAGDRHFNKGVFKTSIEAAHYAITNAIGVAKSILEHRRRERKAKRK